MATSGTLTTPNADEDMEQQEPPFVAGGWGGCKMAQLLWMAVGQFLIKLNILSPFHPAIAILTIYSNELKIYVRTKTCVGMFVAALFITAKTRKQPRCPSASEWINK